MQNYFKTNEKRDHPTTTPLGLKTREPRKQPPGWLSKIIRGEINAPKNTEKNEAATKHKHLNSRHQKGTRPERKTFTKPDPNFIARTMENLAKPQGVFAPTPKEKHLHNQDKNVASNKQKTDCTFR